MSRREVRRPVLVTGATGFVGSHLVDRLLADGHTVRALVRSRTRAAQRLPAVVEVVQGDITDPAAVAAAVAGCRTVHHVAAHVREWDRWDRFEAITVQGTANVVRACLAARVDRLVLLSTAVVYDDRYARRARLVTEDAPLGQGDRAYGNYSRSKVMAEELCWRAHRDQGLPLVVLRPAWIYGPRDDTILPHLLDHFRSPWACWIGFRDPSSDLVHVSDVAGAMVLAAEAPQALGQAYNVAPVEEVRLRYFIGRLLRRLDLPTPRWTLPLGPVWAAAQCFEAWGRLVRQQSVPLLTRSAIACITVDQHVVSDKAQRELGWAPRVSLEDGVNQTVQWLTRPQPTAAGDGRGRDLG